MRLDLATCAAVLLASTASATGQQSKWRPDPTFGSDVLAGMGMINVAISQLTSGAGHDTKKCSLRTAVVRREWSTMSNSERTAYTNAVLCLATKPSKSPAGFAAGAKNRYDDFVAHHVNSTLNIHGTANFLAWHRLFVWNYEEALRNECGYKGYQPYWNWGKSASDPVNSAYFDGSAYSMGGNGVFAAHNCTNALPSGVNCIPPGSGGGCVKTGPFKNWTVNISPTAPTSDAAQVPATGFLAYEPRCLSRDISQWVSSRWLTDAGITDLIANNKEMGPFQDTMQGVVDGTPFLDGFYGVHAGGHYTIGGDPGGDFFVSPGDPMFWLHHGQIDRTWWIWQNQDLKNRQNAIAGSIYLFNDPPLPLGTLNDWMDMGACGKSATIGDVMDTQGEFMCYIYL
ncbi:hypothetical protein V492_06902 [Pseudogymnoascus sp. VKM F-4246]|nr:hypothetical protein V492_06902 [Pseudogymnoascus sp. VKM F-4246]